MHSQKNKASAHPNNSHQNQGNKKFSFDEFLLYYGSTEKVTDRRIEANRWNYTVCTAIIIACATILAWATSYSNLFSIALVTVIILSVMAILFCRFWIAQIRDLKMLNNAKFEVLNEMAHHISFSSSTDDERQSFLPFEKEWETLKKTKTAIEFTNTNIFVLSSSDKEYLIPSMFIFLFIFILVATFVLAVMNWGLLTNPSSLTFLITSTPTMFPKLTP
jgi:ABC-type multidrug transport system fused ATPase/permease subunit